MAALIPDDIDFSEYERETDCKAKVRPASVFSDELDAAFTPRTSGQRRSTMRSTNLRNAIEFRPGEVSVWAGYNGHRKSMFTGQVAMDMCADDQPTLVMSLEMPPRETLKRMCMQACAVEVPRVDDRRAFMRWTDGRLWLFDHVGGLTPSKCMAVCRYFAEKHSGAHVFIDSFMKVCASEESMDAQKAMVGDLCDVAKETGLHLHLIAHCRKPSGGAEDKPPTKYDIKGSGAITDQPHNVLLIWDNKPKRAEFEKPPEKQDPKYHDQHDAVITLDKQRNGRVEGRFGMWFDDASLRFCDYRGANPEPMFDVEAA